MLMLATEIVKEISTLFKNTWYSKIYNIEDPLILTSGWGPKEKNSKTLG